MKTNLAQVIREAMRRDGRTVYAFSRDSGLRVSLVQAFAKGGGLTLKSADKLCELLSLRLVADAKKGR